MTAQPVVEVCIQGYATDNCQPRCTIVLCGLQHITAPGQLAAFVQAIYAAVDRFYDAQQNVLPKRRGHHKHVAK